MSMYMQCISMFGSKYRYKNSFNVFHFVGVLEMCMLWKAECGEWYANFLPLPKSTPKTQASHCKILHQMSWIVELSKKTSSFLCTSLRWCCCLLALLFLASHFLLMYLVQWPLPSVGTLAQCISCAWPFSSHASWLYCLLRQTSFQSTEQCGWAWELQKHQVVVVNWSSLLLWRELMFSALICIWNDLLWDGVETSCLECSNRMLWLEYLISHFGNKWWEGCQLLLSLSPAWMP